MSTHLKFGFANVKQHAGLAGLLLMAFAVSACFGGGDTINTGDSVDTGADSASGELADSVDTADGDELVEGFTSRIAFVSDYEGSHQIYTMFSDGSDLRQLTDGRFGSAAKRFPSWSPDGTRIAFISERRGDGGIFTISSSSVDSYPEQLMGNQPDDFSIDADSGAPSWSPDGTRIAFSASDRDGDYEVYTMFLDGSDVRKLTGNRSDDLNPSYSPDGTRIAFVSDRDGNKEIYTMSSDGANQRRLTDNQFDDLYPSWSPDGTRIAFVSDRDGNEEIYTMSSDGADQRRLTDNQYADFSPSWSPKGSSIVFISNRNDDFGVYTISASDGSAVTRLIDGQILDGLHLEPSWSPPLPIVDNFGGDLVDRVADAETRNSRIAFVCSRNGYDHIYTSLVGGSDRRQLTDNQSSSDFYQHPSWSPDGTRIAFSAGEHDYNGSAIYTISSDGSDVRQLTDNEAEDWFPSWSPDGARIAFSSNRDGDFEIYTMSSDGTGVKQLTEFFGATSPAWSPDGTHIAFSNGGVHVILSDWSNIIGPLRGAVEYYDYNLFVLGAPGEEGFFIINDGFYPSWSPSGLRIAYSYRGSIYTVSLDTYSQSLGRYVQRRLTSCGNGRSSWSPFLP